MPELPEVESIRRGIEGYLLNESILYTVIYNSHLKFPISSEIFRLKKQPVLSVERRGKYLLIKLPEGWIIIHFGMSGSLHILPNQQLAKKHDHIDLIISNNKILRYNDPRRFGFWLWSVNLKNNTNLSHLGPEPLSKEFNGIYLFDRSRRKKTSIKQWLMDTKVVAGIGNIYANESLFRARILPHRPIMSLEEKETVILVNAIKEVLVCAIDQGGTTLRDFMQPNGNPGYFTQQLQVYSRSGKPCYICKTPISSEKQNQRTTFWCSKCQR